MLPGEAPRNANWFCDGPRDLIEGCFTQPTAAVPAWRPELVFMPHNGRSL
jgi:hypothetical protein